MVNDDRGRRIEAIILDVGGVFLLPDPRTIGDHLASAGLDAAHGSIVRAHYAGIRALDLRGEWDAYLDAFVGELGLPDDALARASDALREVWFTENLWRFPVQESVAGLRHLALSGRKLGIVSNADGTVEAQLRAQSIAQVGEGLGVPVLAIIDSTVFGSAKPEPAIFRHAVEQLGVAPEHAVYIGDSVRYDVRGARAAGLHPVHFDPYDFCSARQDHPHVRAIADTVELLGRPLP